MKKVHVHYVTIAYVSGPNTTHGPFRVAHEAPGDENRAKKYAEQSARKLADKTRAIVSITVNGN